jgi:hypothetical protein
MPRCGASRLIIRDEQAELTFAVARHAKVDLA